MISAGIGETPYPTQQAGYPQQGYGSPYGYGGGPSYVQPTMPAYNPGVGLSGPSIAIETNKVDYDKVAPIMWGNVGVQALAVIGGIFAQNWAANVAIKGMETQLALGQSYYATQDSIAGKQQEVAIQQLMVQGKAIDAQVQMHTEQVDHEKAMAELEGNAQARITELQEKYKTKRAEIYSVTDAFSSRGGWDMGSPAFAA